MILNPKIRSFSLFIGIVIGLTSIDVYAQSDAIPVPNARQLTWQEAAFGVIFHYDLNVFDGVKYNQAYNRITPFPDYNAFHPDQLNVEQWVLAAKAAGARFALLTATHETGFALYPSDVNPYCTKALKWKEGKGDIVRDFVDACRKHGILPGIYLGIRWNSFFGVHNFKVEGEAGSPFQKNRQAYYNKMVEGMVTEICTRYGPLFEIWFDGGASGPGKGAPDVLPIVQKFQPGCLFYHNDQLAEARWGGSESGTVPYPCWSTFPFPSTSQTHPEIQINNFQLMKTGDPDGKYWVPAMADAPLRGYQGRHEWLWEPGDDAHIFPLEQLMKIYAQSVGRNATLIMGLTPDDRGLMPEPDVQRLKEWGEALQAQYGHPIRTISGKGTSVSLKLAGEVAVQQILVREKIAGGHRVRAFRLQAKVNRKWIDLQAGSAIGQCYIWHTTEPVTTGEIRLVVDQAIGTPDITEFSVYDTDPDF